MALKSLFEKLQRGLVKTREALGERFRTLLSTFRKIDEPFLDQLEETLLAADIGVEMASQLRREIQKAYGERRIESVEGVVDYLKTTLKVRLKRFSPFLRFAEHPPTVILVVGVNGTGKTTSIAKLARHLKTQGRSVLLAAGDTFRAAAQEQLSIWGERLGLEVIHHQAGADPAAVAYDGLEAALARGVDSLIVDTAGRLQTKTNLMKELTKIRNVLAKKVAQAPHEVLLVLDATTGQNALSQARQFHSALPVTGIFLAKLDGTAKGGIVVAIQEQLNIPVKFVGVGESAEDIEPFDTDGFVDGLFG